MADKQFEVAVIGGGPGGYVCAIRAAQLGFKTCIVEKNETLGGTCLNVGCIPSKALLASTEHVYEACQHFLEHGINIGKVEVDLAAMMARKDKVVSSLTGGLVGLMKKNKIEHLTGFAKLSGAHSFEVTPVGGDAYTVEAENIVLATGSAPIELPFLPFDGTRVLHSTHALALKEVPAKMAVIGGGAIGLEMASVWSRVGAEVTVIEFLPRIAALGYDEDVSKFAQKLFEKQGIAFSVGTKVESAEVTAEGVKLQAKRGEHDITFEADVVLVAVGRRPYAEGLGAVEAGVTLTDRGRIEINDRWQTSVPSIYAIGDVVDGPMLAHKAEEEGVAVAECLAGKPGHVNKACIPNVVYTEPEIASVGLTTAEAKDKGHEVKVGKFNFAANGRALAADQTDGFAKVIADAKTDRVLGVQILGTGASELIAEAVLLMEYEGSSEDLGRTIHAHPTTAEALKEAALAVQKRAIHS